VTWRKVSGGDVVAGLLPDEWHERTNNVDARARDRRAKVEDLSSRGGSDCIMEVRDNRFIFPAKIIAQVIHQGLPLIRSEARKGEGVVRIEFVVGGWSKGLSAVKGFPEEWHPDEVKARTRE
jgi:hypothetical protein